MRVDPVGVRRLAAALALGALFPGAPAAYELEIVGFVEGEVRAFFESASRPRQARQALFPSLAVQPELRLEWAGGDHRLTAVGFGRFDARDDRRTHADVRELDWLVVGPDWDFRFGVGKVFWGVVESRHLVNVVNQVDFVEDLDEEDHLGQPMAQLTLLRDWGTLAAFYFPYFRERTFPGAEGRLRFPFLVDVDRPLYDSGLEEWFPGGALRWSHVVGDVDLGLAHFSGVGREPRFRPEPVDADTIVLRPLYDRIHQESVDAQLTRGSWLWKLEALTRVGQGGRFAAVAGGVEYTFFDLNGTGADVGLLAEYLYDGRDDDPTRAPPTAFEDDFFGGARLALNDVQSTAILAGAFVDRETQATFVNVEAERRFGDRWFVGLDLRVLANVPSDDILSGLRRDDHLQLRIARYF